MGLRERYRQLPPNPFRPRRRDVLIGLADALISGMDAVAGATKRVRMPGELDRTIALTVADRRVVAHDQDVIALTLVGEQLPRWHPGAHIDIHLPSGLVRQYSLCGDPETRGTYRIAVRRIPDGGGGSIEMHDLRVGANVTTKGPRNAFPLTVPGYGSPARRFRFIAGGIGITPILPMLGLAQHLGVDWSMIYAGRNRDSLPFVDDVSRFAAVYACGPAPMLTAIRSELVGRDNVELHFERFAVPPVVDGREFSVSIASTGQTVRVGADETLLSALNRAGVHAS